MNPPSEYVSMSDINDLNITQPSKDSNMCNMNDLDINDFNHMSVFLNDMSDLSRNDMENREN